MSNDESFGREAHQRLRGDEGSNLVEYAMLMALIVVVCLSAVQVFANNANKKFSCSSSAIAAAGTGAPPVTSC